MPCTHTKASPELSLIDNPFLLTNVCLIVKMEGFLRARGIIAIWTITLINHDYMYCLKMPCPMSILNRDSLNEIGQDFFDEYFMSKKTWPILYSNLLYKLSQILVPGRIHSP